MAWSPYLAAALFALACFTDWLDGYLARVLNQMSKLGAFLDPVADKLIVSVCLVLLVAEPRLPYLAIPAAIIICREIVISALREWMSVLGKRQHLAVNLIITEVHVDTCPPSRPVTVGAIGVQLSSCL